jgi:hypothetical protein
MTNAASRGIFSFESADTLDEVRLNARAAKLLLRYAEQLGVDSDAMQPVLAELLGDSIAAWRRCRVYCGGKTSTKGFRFSLSEHIQTIGGSP